MSEPFLERLSRFTPDRGGLDRDGLIFAAGRSSARPNRPWQALAGLLTGTQALLVVLLLTRAEPPADRSSMRIAAVPAATPGLQPSAGSPEANPGLWSARHRLDDPEPEDRPADTLTLIDSEPPPQVFGPSESVLAN
jgi:hypothetical protein